MSYELGQLEEEISLEFYEIDVVINHMNKLSRGDIALESFIGLCDVSVEGAKFELLTSYVERIYSTLMSVLTRILNFVRKMWTRASLGVRSDELVKELIIILGSNKSFNVEPTKLLKRLVGKNLAYFHLKNKSTGVSEDDANDMIKNSNDARKAMLNGDPINVELGNVLYHAHIEKAFTFNSDTSGYKSDFEFLSAKGNIINLLATSSKDAVYGTGFKVISATVKNGMFSKIESNALKDIDTKSALKDLEDMMSIDTLYRVLVDGVFEEISAIRHDLEASRLRMLKEARSSSEGTLDDIQVHNANIRAHSQSARVVAGMSKALMYIGNGMINDRNMRIKVAREISKQITGEK